MASVVDDWDTLCAVCSSGSYRGDLRLREFGEAAGERAEADDLEGMCLCGSCFGLLRSTLKAAVKREGNVDHLPTLPDRRRPSAASQGCEVCWEALARQWFVAELNSGSRLFTAPLLRLGERPQRARMCASCVTWLRDFIDEESVARWTLRRRTGVERLHTEPERPLRCQGIRVLGHDRGVLKDALRDLGHSYRDSGAAPDPSADVIFLWAGALGAGEAQTMTAATLARTVVVTTSERTGAAIELMLAGARDLLVTPLSRQQVIGALDRLSDPDAFAGRDEATGLPSYRPEPRFGLPCHLVGVELPEEVSGLDVFLTLRRFLRGYDRVGLDSGTLVPVVIYCPEDDVERVMGRMKGVLGDGFDFRLLATVTGEGPPDEAQPLTGEARDSLKLAG